MKKILIIVALLSVVAVPAFALDGKALYQAKKCSMCHGPAGRSSNNMFPSLAGKDASYLAQETLKIKTGKRTGPMSATMKNNRGVSQLSKAEAMAIGQYLSAQ